MKHLDLFSGIGGFTLAARSLGIETVQFVDSFSGWGLSQKIKSLPAHWSSIESPICGVAHGLSHRLDKLAVLGNSVVPSVAAAVRIPKGIALKRVLFLESWRTKND